MMCISASFYSSCKFIQASQSTSSYSEHTVNRSLLRLFLNPSVKCITMLTTEDTIKLMSIYSPIPIFQNNFPHMHSPSHPSILGRCIHVQVSTTIVQVTLAHLQVPLIFLMYLHQVSVSTGHLQMCL